MKQPTVSIIVVARNESANISNILRDITTQTYNHKLIEIVLVDSDSEDDTKEHMLKFMREYEMQFKKIKILDNKKRVLPAGWNIGIINSETELVCRIDAHASIPSDFIEKNVQQIKSGERASGGHRPNVLSPNDMTQWNKVLLLAEVSIFGSGIAPYRNSQKKRYVKSIFHGVYEKQIFDEIGLLNENLVRTEDNEIHYRMRKAGINLSYDPEIVSYQYVRSSLRTMIKQKYYNGYWIGKTMAVCPGCFSVFHFVPLIFVISLIISLLILPINVFPLAILSILYGGVLALITFSLLFKNRNNLLVLFMPIILFCLHTSYGMGTLIGLFSLLERNK